MAAWIALIGLSLFLNWKQADRTAFDLARTEARAHFNKDLVYRIWATMHGGVYVPPTDLTPPNPYLAHLSDRDVITTAGRQLTLVNPAYMTRQVHDIGRELYGVMGHITSLNPLRPQNAPDDWEARAMLSFEKGAAEIGSVELIKGEPFLRFMKPMVTSAGCLKCHAAQGYKEGDIRGAISVSVPFGPYLAIAGRQQAVFAWSHVLVALSGILGFVFALRFISRSYTNLAVSEGRFRELVNASPNPILVMQDRRYVYANPACLLLLGYTADELARIDVLDIVDRSIRSTVDDRIKNAQAGKPNQPVEMRLVKKDGGYAVTRSVSVPIEYQGRPAVLITSQDITAHKEAEERLAREREQSEQALRESERYLRTILQTTMEGFWVLAKDGGFLEVNEAYRRMSGYSQDELQRMSIHDIDNHAQRSTVADRIARVIRNGSEFFQARHRKKDGGIIQVEISATYLDLNGGRLICFCRDITAQKQAQEELKESEEKYRLTFSGSPDAVTINRLDDGLYTDVNDGFTRLTGFTREEVLGRTSLQVNIWHDPSDRGRLVDALRTRGHCDNLEARFRRKDSSLTTALMSARILNLRGEPHIVSITRDISERKQAEAERERLLLAIEQASELVVITDASGTIEYVNPAFEKVTGYEAGRAVGQNPRLLKSGMQTPGFYRDLWTTILSGHPWKGRIVNKRRDGTLYTAECSISPIRNRSGEVVSFVWISRDITNELELEKRMAQSQKMEAIGVLAGGIAHDFNNLLFPIIGLAELMMEDTQPGSLNHENAEEIYKAARRAGDLVRQILSFSRRAEPRKTLVHVQKVLKEALKLARSIIPSNIEFIMDIKENCGPIMADATQIHQVAMNLITNAYHAVKQTGGAISVGLAEVIIEEHQLSGSGTWLTPGMYVLLSVTDTGHGIPDEIAGKIFEPYFTTKEQGEGTGLGLSVVYGIVKECGGDIQVVSKAGEGAAFRILLPILLKEPTPGKSGLVIPICGGTERILLVDDEEAIAQLVTKMLRRLGYQVEKHTSSLEALQAFRSDPDAYDLVITDMTMPKMMGDEFASHILAVRSDVPVMICTGYSERINREKARSMGVRGFLMKPVARNEMADLVRALLDGDHRSGRD